MPLPTYLLIEHFATLPQQLQLYSVRRDEEGQKALATDFYARMRQRIRDDPSLQPAWEAFDTNLDRIARRNYSLLAVDCLRSEEKATALPSKPSYLYRMGLAPPIDFRLYCFPAGPRTLILFNGDIKTHQNPDHCLQVGPHFRLAKRLARSLEKVQSEWEIGPDNTIHPDPFEFEF